MEGEGGAAGSKKKVGANFKGIKGCAERGSHYLRRKGADSRERS